MGERDETYASYRRGFERHAPTCKGSPSSSSTGSRRLLHTLIQRLARGFLERMGAVGQAVGGDLPEEDAAESLLHGPFGLDGDRLGIVVADDDRTSGEIQPGVLGLVVPLRGPALLAFASLWMLL